MNVVQRGLGAMCCLRALLFAALIMFASSLGASAVEPNEILKDPELEKRARSLSAELRCLVCQNQSIDDSNAPLARDLRLLVRERLTAGDSDAAVIDYIVARYGEFVLLRPQFGWHTLLLWLSPLLLLAAGLVLARMVVARQWQNSESLPAAATVVSKPLTAEEQKRLQQLLKAHR